MKEKLKRFDWNFLSQSLGFLFQLRKGLLDNQFLLVIFKKSSCLHFYLLCSVYHLQYKKREREEKIILAVYRFFFSFKLPLFSLFDLLPLQDETVPKKKVFVSF